MTQSLNRTIDIEPMVAMNNWRDHEGRYGRQLALKGFGEEGQERLARSKVVVIGCGALGTTASNLLARAGIGNMVLVDRDIVELSNLQRQLIFDMDDLDRPKAMAAAEALHLVNPDIGLAPVVADVNEGNVEGLVQGATVVIDGTDNLATRFLLNDACLRTGVPWIYGGAISTSGMAMTILSGGRPCLSCLFPDPPSAGTLPTCESAGILNTVTSHIGTHQANEALRLMMGMEPTRGLLVIDEWSGDHRVMEVRPRDDCPACQKGEMRYLEARAGGTGMVTTLCGNVAVQVRPGNKPRDEGIDLKALANRLEGSGQVTATSYFVRLLLEGLDITVFKDGRAIIRGIDDPDRARAIYDRFIGS